MGFRRAVQWWFYCVGACVAVIAIIFATNASADARDVDATATMLGLYIGIPAGTVLWILVGLLRFAFGEHQRSLS